MWKLHVEERMIGIVIIFSLNDDVMGSILVDNIDDIKGLADELIKINPRVNSGAGQDRVIAN